MFTYVKQTRIKMQLPLLLVGVLLLSSSTRGDGRNSCRCDLYLPDGETLVLSTGLVYPVPCNDLNKAKALCDVYCQSEVRQLNEGFNLYPNMMTDSRPYLNTCPDLPQVVVPFYSYCNQSTNVPSNERFSKMICCDPTGKFPEWCDNEQDYNKVSQSLNLGDGAVVAESRKLDTKTDKNAIENNEIEGSTKDTIEQETLKDTTESSWLEYMMKFFGYTSISEMMNNIDIFSLPAKIREAVVTYGDEIGMGQCYMEFTTYSVFTRQENPLEAFLRTKRDVDCEASGGCGRDIPTARQNQVQTIKTVVEGVTDLLKRSDSTRQYADVITKLLPTVLKIYSSNDPQEALSSVFTQVVAPFLAQQMQQRPRPVATNSIDKNEVQPASWPSYTRPSSQQTYQNAPVKPTQSQSNPVQNIVMSLVKNYISSYLSGPKVEKVSHPVTKAPIQRPVRPQTSSSASSGLGTILGLLLGGGNSGNTAKPAAQISRPRPPVKKVKPQSPELVEKKKRQDFTDMILEVVRPVFISIVGKTPGETGVESIREVSRLSTQGRVDDALKEEVLSPFFCAKNYLVNKAWTVTERGIRSVIASFTPQARERMKKMLF